MLPVSRAAERATRTADRTAARPRPKVLVIGDDTRSFLAIVRSLGRQGIQVHAAPFGFGSPALKSRYLRRCHRLPPYLGDGGAWVAAVRRLFRARRFDLVIPCDERSLLPLSAHRAEFEPGPRLAIPDATAIEVLYDKVATRRLAESVGVPIAAGGSLEAEASAESLAERFGLPLVIKPASSYQLSHLHARSNVVIGRDLDGLRQAVARGRPGETLIEGFFPGRGVGVSVLADSGRIVQAFQHDRVHEASETGGSSYRVSVAVDPDLEAACGRMLGAIGYRGVAMFEFRRNDATGDWILLEINARPWGSLPLPVAAGVDFPYCWYRLLVDGVAEPRAEYRTGLYGRHFASDYNYFALSLARRRGQPAAALAFASGYVCGYWRWLAGREANDALVADDPRPGLAEIGELIGGRLTRVSESRPGRAELRRQRAEAAIRDALTTLRPDGPAVVFVCQGNICRSPFASHWFRHHRAPGLAHLTVASAGMLPVAGRPSPEPAVRSARSHAVDITGHRSRYLDWATTRTAALVVAFDRRNLESIRQRYPDLPVPVLALGDLLDPPVEIADPYGHDAATYESCYRMIVAALDRLNRLLTVAAGDRVGRWAGADSA